MSDERKISDPHLARLLLIARQGCGLVGGEIGQASAEVAEHCAVQIQGYIQQMHQFKNEVMALQGTIEESGK